MSVIYNVAMAVALSISFLGLSAQPRWTVEREALTKGDEFPLRWPRLGLVNTRSDLYISDETQSGRSIYVFDSTGKALGIIGRKGRGPGEFESISGLGFRGDTLWVYDRSLRRVTYFSKTGKVLKTLPENTIASEAELLGILKDGTLIAKQSAMSKENGRRFYGGNEPNRIVRLAAVDAVPSTSGQDSLGYARMNGMGFLRESPGGTSVLWNPVRTEDPIALSADGSRVAIVNAHDEGGYTLIVRDTRRQLFSVKRSAPPTPIDRGTLERWVGSGDGSEDAKIRIAGFMKPRFMSPATAVLIGSDNYTWVRREGTIIDMLVGPADSVQWDIFDPGGKLVGIVRLPMKLRVFAAGPSTLWAAEEDENGVWQLVRFRVRRPQ
jgi:hypothetical protein